jgi:hypothetical protein
MTKQFEKALVYATRIHGGRIMMAFLTALMAAAFSLHYPEKIGLVFRCGLFVLT